MASTLSRLSTCLNGAFDGETPTFLCDSQAVVAALKDAGLPAYSFTEMDSLEPSQLEKVVMIPIVFERTPRGSVIEKTFESTAMLVLPIASFCGTARGALYFLEMLSKIDLDRCINGNLEWLDRLETLPSIRMEGDGTDIKVEFDDEIFLMSPKTTQSIQPGEWVSIAQYLEVGLTSHRNGQRPRHTMNGTMVASGFVVASHRYAAAEVFPMQAEAWKYLRNLQGAANGAPIVVEVRDSRPVSITCGGREVLADLMDFTDPNKREYVAEFAFAADPQWDLDTVDWSVNSQLNEAIGGMHLGLGNGVTGAHIDLVAPTAIYAPEG